MSGEAKLDILTRINRAGTQEQEPFARAPIRPPARSREDRSPEDRSPEDIVAQFAEYAAEYRANVRRVEAASLPDAIRQRVGAGRVILPPGLPREWLAPNPNAEEDRGQAVAELDKFQAVVTGCAVAIAESGTLVLDHGAAQGRRALTLIPDHHVCVVFEDQVVEHMGEAVAALQPRVLAGRPLTFISGPSATSDIELSRVEGVHGPRRLDILLVAGGSGRPELGRTS